MRQKRFLSWLLTLCLLLGMFSFPAYAEVNTTTISGDGTADKTGTMTITLVIPKKTPAATDLTYTAPSDLTYSGSDKVATVAAASGVTGLGTITVKYYSDASRSTEVTETKNVGTYYVGATVAEGDQYAASTAVLYGNGWTFTITASTPSAPAAPTKASATKNSITLNAVSGCEYSKDGANWQSGTEFTGLLPGTEYTFYQRVKATANTNASAASNAKFSTEADTYAMTITLVIKPAQTIAASDVTATYGDTDKSVSASVTEPTTGGGAITYAVKDGSGDYISVNESTGALTIKAVPPTDGKAYVIVTAAETDDYAEATKEVVVTISKATVTVAAENQSIYVNGTVPDLSAPVLDTHYTVTGLVGEDALTTAPVLAYQKDGSAATPDNTTAGTYDIVPTGAAASDNYSISYTNGTLTISSKGTQTITAENVTATYGDTDKSVSATVTDPATGGGAISYAVKEGSGDYIEVNASTGALTIKKVPADGKAYVTVTAAETATYAQATKDVTVTINKANAVLATVAANNHTYDGTEKPLVTVDESTLAGGEMWYALSENATDAPADNLYTTSIPTATNAGTYYVWYKAVGDDNHNDSEAACVTVTINPASVTLTANSGTETYDGSEKTVTGFTSSVTGLTFTGVSASGTGTNAGEYAVTFSGVTANETKDSTGNYVATGTTNGKLTIEPKAVTITAKDANKDYDGTALTEAGFTTSALEEGDTHTFTVAMTEGSTITNAGTQPNVIATVDGIEVATGTATAVGSYSVTVADGTLTVNKADIAPTVSITGWYVRAAANEPVVTGNPGNGNVTYAYKVKDAADDTYSADVPTEAGSYTVRATVAETDNYKGGESTADFTISRQPSSGGGGGGGSSATANLVNVPASGTSAGGSVKSSAASARAGDKVTITPQPDEGYVTAGVTVTDAKDNAVPVTKNADGTYSFTMPATAVTVTPTFAVAGGQPPADDGSCPKDSTCPISKFSDASPTAWYHDGVHWALVEEIMNGTSDTTFAPNGTATRAMVVTMLWRLAGEPAANAPAPFTDVEVGSWYANAVNWAAETGAVNGTSADTFSPNTPVTREQLAAVLYRYAQAQGQGFTGAWMFPLDFSDAASVSEWADEAMHWMTMHGIITGMGDGTLAPKDNATRAQIATMFMRFCEELEK